ncbi:hypothetical protein WME98_10600 [Sorangium sp. So ce296]|uniref:hypothetical protein n=1 Tax=Sorangium sp. So ce296 TaxID=3133296 RepID=UPI003F5E0072
MAQAPTDALTTSIGACISRAREVINETWQPLMQATHLGADNEEETRLLQQQLDWQLQTASESLLILLEMLGAPRAAERFTARWDDASGKMSLALDAGDMDYVSCPRFEMLSATFESLVPEATQAVTLRAKQDIVKEALECTPKIVKASNKTPNSETDLHTIIHKHMEATFVGYLRKTAIATSPKYYIPDGAFPTLELAIEWKYLRNKDDLKRAIDEIKTDINSYGQSRLYTRFFGVFYQINSSICTPRELKLAFGNPTPSWDMILVTAP